MYKKLTDLEREELAKQAMSQAQDTLMSKNEAHQRAQRIFKRMQAHVSAPIYNS